MIPSIEITTIFHRFQYFLVPETVFDLSFLNEYIGWASKAMTGIGYIPRSKSKRRGYSD